MQTARTCVNCPKGIISGIKKNGMTEKGAKLLFSWNNVDLK